MISYGEVTIQGTGDIKINEMLTLYSNSLVDETEYCKNGSMQKWVNLSLQTQNWI